MNSTWSDQLQQMLLLWHLAVNSTTSKTYMYGNHPQRQKVWDTCMYDMDSCNKYQQWWEGMLQEVYIKLVLQNCAALKVVTCSSVARNYARGTTFITQPNSITRQEQYGFSLCHVDSTPGHPPSCLQCSLIYFLTFPTHNYPSVLPAATLKNHFMCSFWLHKSFLSLGLGIVGFIWMICVLGPY